MTKVSFHKSVLFSTTKISEFIGYYLVWLRYTMKAETFNNPLLQEILLKSNVR